MQLKGSNRDATVTVTIDIRQSLASNLFPDQVPGREQGPVKIELLTTCVMTALSISSALKTGTMALDSLQALNNAIPLQRGTTG